MKWLDLLLCVRHKGADRSLNGECILYPENQKVRSELSEKNQGIRATVHNNGELRGIRPVSICLLQHLRHKSFSATTKRGPTKQMGKGT
jgi:hypothetical protein